AWKRCRRRRGPGPRAKAAAPAAGLREFATALSLPPQVPRARLAGVPARGEEGRKGAGFKSGLTLPAPGNGGTQVAGIHRAISWGDAGANPGAAARVVGSGGKPPTK